MTLLNSHRQERQDVENLNQDERVAFALLSEFDLTPEEMIDLVYISFKQRHRELFTPTAHDS
jgi:hypothetical protein